MRDDCTIYKVVRGVSGISLYLPIFEGSIVPLYRKKPQVRVVTCGAATLLIKDFIIAGTASGRTLFAKRRIFTASGFSQKDLNYGLNVVAPCAGFHTAVYQKPKFGRGLVTFITQLIVCRVGQFDHDLHVRKSSRLVSEVSPLHQSSNRFKRSALLITETELNVMATLAITGLSRMLKKG